MNKRVLLLTVANCSSCFLAVSCDLLDANPLSFLVFIFLNDCLTTRQMKESPPPPPQIRREYVVPIRLQEYSAYKKPRPDASQFQLGNGSWQQAWASDTWTRRARADGGRMHLYKLHFKASLTLCLWERKAGGYSEEERGTCERGEEGGSVTKM